MKTKVTIGLITAVVLSAVAYWFVMWNLKRSFQLANWNVLTGWIEGPLGELIAEKAIAHPGLGAITFNRKNPGEFERDKEYFETWRSAFTIAKSTHGHEMEVQEWTSATNFDWIPPSDRRDAWRHAFCFRSFRDQVVVVSPGPQALASMDCRSLEIAENKFATMPAGKLAVQGAGELILVVPWTMLRGK